LVRAECPNCWLATFIGLPFSFSIFI
jgi:hypothetical protein